MSPRGRVIAVVVVALFFLAGLAGIVQAARGGSDRLPQTQTQPQTQPLPPTPLDPISTPSAEDSPGPAPNPKPRPKKKTKVIHVAGVTLDSAFSQEDFGSLVNDDADDVELGSERRCGLLANQNDVTLTVLSVSAHADDGEITTSDTGDCGPEWSSQLNEPFNRPGNHKTSCRGQTLRPNQGCWFAVRMSTLPAEQSRGTITMEVQAICTDAEGACNAVEDAKPSASNPVKLISSTTYSFLIEAGEPSDDASTDTETASATA